MTRELVDVALFPIPNAVAFPGTVLPLHVFEPRYRRLVRDCVAEGRMVGVSHTLKRIHQPQRAQSDEELLRSNQATYKPHSVFSAGDCRIVETTPDGRMVVAITMRQRLSLLDELQSLPYRIVRCRVIEDDEAGCDQDRLQWLQRAIHRRLIELVGRDDSETGGRLADPGWSLMTPGDYSFQIFQLLRFEAHEMQALLETQSVSERLELTWQLLSGGPDH